MITWSHARARHTDRMAGRRGASERGETLIEIMVTLVLLGTGFVSIMGAIFTATNISDANQEQTKASIAVQAFAEALLQPAGDPPASLPGAWYPQLAYRYKACAAPSDYQPYVTEFASTALPSGYTATIVRIRYFFTYSGNPSIPVFTNATLTQDAATKLCDGTTSPPGYVTTETVTDISGAPQSLIRDRGIQEITVQIDSGTRRKPSVDTLVFLKRDQRCPGTYQNADLGPC